MPARHAAVILAALVLAGTIAAPADAAIRATVSVPTSGGTRIVVKLTSTTRVAAAKRPRSVRLKAGKLTFKLTRAKASAAVVSLGTWRTAKLTGTAASAARALRGSQVSVVIGSAAGTQTLRRQVVAGPQGTTQAPEPGSTTPATPGPADKPFNAPGRELSGQEAFDNFKQYFLNSEFSDCQAGNWPACSVENRYEHTADGHFEYHRCTPTSGSDINFYDNATLTGSAQHADGSWVVEYTTSGGAGFYHWEVGTNGIVNGYYSFQGGPPEILSNYYWRQPAHPGSCYQ